MNVIHFLGALLAVISTYYNTVLAHKVGELIAVAPFKIWCLPFALCIVLLALTVFGVLLFIRGNPLFMKKVG
jgi:hypothetical protein